MAAIYDEVVLNWEGEEYIVQPSYKMIQSIESKGVSIVGLSNRLMQGEPPMSQIALVISHMLQSAGARSARPDEVYAHLLSEADEDELQWLCEAVVTAFTPRRKDQSKNDDAPRKASKKKASSKK